jgi:hypothetical protein
MAKRHGFTLANNFIELKDEQYPNNKNIFTHNAENFAVPRYHLVVVHR